MVLHFGQRSRLSFFVLKDIMNSSRNNSQKNWVSINAGLNSAREAIGLIEALTKKTKNPIKMGVLFF
jgi:hypothetical protein